jgi:transcriptional regulator with XRE-family HTH domain
VFNKINLSKGHIGMDGEELKSALGQNIKNIRTHRQYSQAELAEKADISIIYLSNIERGKKFPKPAILSQIAESLDVEIYELFKTNHVPVTQNINKKYINRISKDITQKVIQAMETGFKKYIK